MILLTGLEYLTIELTIAEFSNTIIHKNDCCRENFKENGQYILIFYISTLNWHFWVLTGSSFKW